jgi:hypothetical protein
MNASRSPQAGRSVVVGLFEREPQARQAIQGVRGLGLQERQVGILAPGQAADASPAATASAGGVAGASPDANRIPGAASDVSGLLAFAAVGNDVARVLVEMGVPEGEARFYASEAAAGRTLLVVDADSQYDAVRDVVLRNGGYDVQSRGAALARPSGAGVQGGSGAAPIDLTRNWDDVASRYEMLWGQHYGTSDATWDQVAPVYRFAWQMANDPRYRGRPWSEAEAAVRQEWESAAGQASWSDVAGPIRDVWEDVADEATTGAEGGADRRIPRQGADQQVAARDLAPPTREPT